MSSKTELLVTVGIAMGVAFLWSINSTLARIETLLQERLPKQPN